MLFNHLQEIAFNDNESLLKLEEFMWEVDDLEISKEQLFSNMIDWLKIKLQNHKLKINRIAKEERDRQMGVPDYD
jgi:hypothetical protein